MVRLVLVADALKDFDGVSERWLLYLHRLEPTFKCRILFNMLAVLVCGGRPYRLELTAGEHRLEDRCCVDCTLSSTCADERVDLVDEQQDVASRFNLLEHLFQPLFEVAAVAAAGDKRAEIEGVQPACRRGCQGRRC